MLGGEVEGGVGTDPREDAGDGGIALEDLGGAGRRKVVELALWEASFKVLEGGAAVEEVADVVVAEDEGLAPLTGVGGGAGPEASPGATEGAGGLGGEGD